MPIYLYKTICYELIRSVESHRDENGMFAEAPIEDTLPVPNPSPLVA